MLEWGTARNRHLARRRRIRQTAAHPAPDTTHTPCRMRRISGGCGASGHIRRIWENTPHPARYTPHPGMADAPHPANVGAIRARF
jgi:hypothetical protein